MSDFTRSSDIKCVCGSIWYDTFPTSRRDRIIGWIHRKIFRDKIAKYLYGPYMVVCAKCRKRRRELEKRNYLQ